MAYAFQYYSYNLFLTKLGGNKFINCIIFGGAEIIIVFIAGYIMSKLRDMTLFKIIFVTGALCYAFFIVNPDWNTIMIYMANCIFIGSLGAWANLAPLIAELRVPPQSLGSVNMIA